MLGASWNSGRLIFNRKTLEDLTKVFQSLPIKNESPTTPNRLEKWMTDLYWSIENQ